MIEVTCERPAIYRITFDETDDNVERRVLQRWSWNKLNEVVECLNSRENPLGTGIGWSAEKAIIDFAALAGHDAKGNVKISYLVANNRHNHVFWINQPVEEFKMLKGEYYIPSGWGIRMTDPSLSGLVRVEIREIGNRFELVGLNGREKERHLPALLSPRLKDWSHAL